jgi:acyl-CoA synthetase (AMP-forming)/AMP-acid ligase II
MASRPDTTIDYWEDDRPVDRIVVGRLRHEAVRVAAELRERGHLRGDPVLVVCRPGITFFRALLGAVFAGLPVVPVPAPATGSTAEAARLRAVCADSGASVVLADEDAVRPVAEVLGRSDVDVLAPEQLAADARGILLDRAGGADPVLLQYTSGSTGDPKGVVVSHANLIAAERAIGEMLGPQRQAVGWLPHHHDMGLVGQMLHPLFAGIPLAFTSPTQFVRRPVTWLRMITEHAGTAMVAPDFAYALCARAVTDGQLAGLDLSSVTRAVIGAEPVRAATLDRFAARFGAVGFRRDAFRPAWGMAEATLIVSGREDDGPRTLVASRRGLARNRVCRGVGGDAEPLVSCGRAATGLDVTVVAPEGRRACRDGEVGELWVRGPSIACGYWRRPAATRERFRASIVRDSRPGPDDWYRSGDLGAVVDGRVYVTGRISEIINVRGRNVYPIDLESRALDAAGAAAAGNAAAFELEPGRIGLVVELTPRALGSEDLDALAATVRRAVTADVGGNDVRVRFVRRGSLPRTTSGKIQRNRVRAVVLGDERAHAGGVR